MIKQIKRFYWTRKFNKLDRRHQMIFKYMGIDPTSLIAKGLL